MHGLLLLLNLRTKFDNAGSLRSPLNRRVCPEFTPRPELPQLTSSTLLPTFFHSMYMQLSPMREYRINSIWVKTHLWVRPCIMWMQLRNLHGYKAREEVRCNNSDLSCCRAPKLIARAPEVLLYRSIITWRHCFCK